MINFNYMLVLIGSLAMLAVGSLALKRISGLVSRPVAADSESRVKFAVYFSGTVGALAILGGAGLLIALACQVLGAK